MTDTAAYTIASAAAAYGVSSDTIRAALHVTKTGGPIPPLAGKKLGQKYLIAAQAMENWFNSLPDA